MYKAARRSFVKKASLLCGASLFATAAPRSLAALREAGAATDVFGQLFASQASAARISRVYLDQISNAKASAASLGVDVATLDPPHADALRNYLRQRITADFAAGNTVTLDGWVLARTEVDACLLAQTG